MTDDNITHAVEAAIQLEDNGQLKASFPQHFFLSRSKIFTQTL